MAVLLVILQMLVLVGCSLKMGSMLTNLFLFCYRTKYLMQGWGTTVLWVPVTFATAVCMLSACELYICCFLTGLVTKYVFLLQCKLINGASRHACFVFLSWIDMGFNTVLRFIGSWFCRITQAITITNIIYCIITFTDGHEVQLESCCIGLCISYIPGSI